MPIYRRLERATVLAPIGVSPLSYMPHAWLCKRDGFYYPCFDMHRLVFLAPKLPYEYANASECDVRCGQPHTTCLLLQLNAKAVSKELFNDMLKPNVLLKVQQNGQ